MELHNQHAHLIELGQMRYQAVKVKMLVTNGSVRKNAAKQKGSVFQTKNLCRDL